MNAAGAVGRSPVIRISTDVTTERGERVYATARNAADSIPVVRTGPTGITEYDPLVLTTSEGSTAFFISPMTSTVRDIIAKFEAGHLPTDDADFVVEHDPGASSLPVPADGLLAAGQRSVLGPCGWADPLDPTEYTLYSTEREASALSDVDLLGRGRGDAATDEPVADVWQHARGADGDSIVVMNANDADSRSQVDQTVLAGAPMSVLDGVAAVAEFVGAEDAVLYLNESDVELQRRLGEAVEAAEGKLPIVPELVVGPDEYRAGEPTAALEAMEGADRIEPRIRPPPPAEYGLYGRPTVIHTPRTFAQVHRALRDPQCFETDTADPGTRLLTVTGDVVSPAVLELGPEADLSVVRDAVQLDGSFKMACVGGVFGGITCTLTVAPTAQSLTKAGLGTDGVVELLNEESCAVANAGERARFASEANSGRCVPGREGTKQLTELLREIYRGSFDGEKIRELGRVMTRSSNCQIGAHAPRPVITAIDAFESEFEAHVDGHCPSGTCTEKL
ncbi:NADH-quinone oxidoreductase subunit F [Halogranum amylolyticum]|uniref:NADH-quinone oxidoreductase subunit F n=1 Tax=Halogranum amylolyticum TaxID=660520 RepID=A0A1H8V9J4_9EURY|nr:NADH-quinone oxidoreductase subunit F [Halogranum amylolyticum]